MHFLLSALLIFFTITSVSAANLFELTAPDIDGSELPLKEFQGKVVLVVNTASRCGFTPQYKKMEEIYRKYKSHGFVVLGFPSNDFNQELSDNKKIKEFCKGFRISFPLFANASVRGPQKQTVFNFLTNSSSHQALQGDVRWNFEKFLVDRQGQVIMRYPSAVPPNHPQIINDIEKLL
jgi:glutathione peroxidase